MPIYSYFIMNKNAGMVFAKDYASIRNEFAKHKMAFIKLSSNEKQRQMNFRCRTVDP